ncbi:branched-chain amino acid ABC transporter substrate-binding protein [Solirubrobacter phytolaccae]|uniref:Branched-chain amino acid ABC transporter substrate-binding protein n=1 Tax=Solirubrobacter phytolaccae TaxID=1404360 RepID=A0A9X3NCJ3_9ACTN|nr:branched-chain amino acid ABC transporter substrate-binding protein [Solirubrobacter phytolaccae]MDA0182604.1 branched-chain amino acid ABC transporter substrate-binding protein [Solirubrobacter phytolaccae]
MRRSAIALALMAAVVVAGCGDKKDKPEAAQLKGAVAIGVLAPTSGTQSARGADLIDGAKLAAGELNAKGGVLGHKVELQPVDDACEPYIAYESAKTFVTDGGGAIGVIGGVCDEVAEREVSTVDATEKPFLVTSATADGIVSEKTPFTFQMNGTLYQQALSSVFWMNYEETERLAVVQDESAESKSIAKQAIGLLEGQPKLVSLQTVEPKGPKVKTIAKAAIAAKPDLVLWTGSAQGGGELVAALREAGFKGKFTATAASEAPEFLSAAGPAGEGATVMATGSPQNTPTAETFRAAFKAKFNREPGFDAQQAYDAVQVLAHAANRAKSTDSAKMVAKLTELDPKFSNALGVVRFAPDHTLLYDNRVILKVKDGKFTWDRSLRTDSLG